MHGLTEVRNAVGPNQMIRKLEQVTKQLLASARCWRVDNPGSLQSYLFSTENLKAPIDRQIKTIASLAVELCHVGLGTNPCSLHMALAVSMRSASAI